MIDLTDGSVVANITGSCNHTFGSAIVVPASAAAPEALHVFSSRWSRFQAPHPWCPSPQGGAASWGGACENAASCKIDVWSTTDPALQAWTKATALRPGFKAYNTDVVRVPRSPSALGPRLPGLGAVTFVMAVEHPGGPVGWESAIYVTNATAPTSGWVGLSSLVRNATDAPAACPCIRYLPEDRRFYVFGAGKFSGASGQSVIVVRSADLASWEPALRPLLSPDNRPGSPDLRAMNGTDLGLLTFDPAAKYPTGGPFASVSAEFKTGRWDRSAADMDAVEVAGGGYFGAGPIVLAYWGASDQSSWGFGQLGIFNGTMAAYLQAPFQ